MAKTTINILEKSINASVPVEVGGDVAIIFKDALRGRVNKVYSINTVDQLTKLYGNGSSEPFKVAKYLLSRGDALKVVRTGLSSITTYNTTKLTVVTGDQPVEPAEGDYWLDGDVLKQFNGTEWVAKTVVDKDAATHVGDIYKEGTDFYQVTEVIVTDPVAASCLFPYSGDTDPNGLKITAAEKGEGYNGLAIKITNQVAGGKGDANLFSIDVYASSALVSSVIVYGALLESFPIVSLNPESNYYFGRVVTSEIIKLEAVNYAAGKSLFANSDTVKIGDKLDQKLANGAGVADESVTAMTEASGLLANKELTFASVLTPGFIGMDQVSILSGLCNNREDIIAFIDATPANPDALIASDEGKVESSFFDMTYPRIKIAALGGFTCTSYKLADLVANLYKKKLWYKSPAGMDYGLLDDVSDVEIELSANDVANLQEAHINPVVVKTSSGCVIWGDSLKTSSLVVINRIGVRLLTNYLKQLVYALSQKYMFRDNNNFTWNQWKNEVEPHIRDIANVNGIVNYEVVCDESIMTPEEIAAGIMKGKITIQPQASIHTIEITFNIDETGVSFNTVEV